MCDQAYEIFWWEIEPYAEPAEEEGNGPNLEKEAGVENQVDGLIMRAVHSLILVFFPKF